MLSSLKEIAKNKTYCEIKFIDGEEAHGVITRVTKSSFDIICFEGIPGTGEQLIIDPEGDQHALLIDEDKMEYKIVKRTCDTTMVCRITHDIGHAVSEKLMKALNFYLTNEIKKKRNGQLVLTKRKDPVIKRNKKAAKKRN